MFWSIAKYAYNITDCRGVGTSLEVGCDVSVPLLNGMSLKHTVTFTHLGHWVKVVKDTHLSLRTQLIGMRNSYIL